MSILASFDSPITGAKSGPSFFVDDIIVALEDSSGPTPDAIDGGIGIDLIFGDHADLFQFIEENTHKTFSSAANIDDTTKWSTQENPTVFDDRVPYTTVLAQSENQDEYHLYTVTVGAQQTLTVDIDYGVTELDYDSSGTLSTDLVVRLFDSDEQFLIADDGSPISEGGLGSYSSLDPYLVYKNESDTAQVYTIFVSGRTEANAGNVDRLGVDGTYMMNVSVTGHTFDNSAVFDDDLIDGGDWGSTIFGVGGNDTLSGSSRSDWLYGGSGDDLLRGGRGTGADRYDGGSGIDTASYDDHQQAVTANLAEPGKNAGGAFGDSYVSIENLTGGRSGDTLIGNAAANALDGGGNDDTLEGGGGDDTLTGSSGRDTLRGDDGNDTLLGGSDHDALFGNEGDDLLIGGSGTDTFNGGTGMDTASYIDVSSPFTFVKADLQVSAWNGGEAALETYTGIEGLEGSKVVDDLRGNQADNTLSGLDNNDYLTGRRGNDALDGGAGRDVLRGGKGNDTLTGGGGNDIFQFDDADPSSTDVITDFEAGADRFRFNSRFFDTLTGKCLSADNFASATAAQDADDFVIYDPAAGNLFYDADGTGASAQVLLATLDPGIALDETDFLIL